jgi:phosphatidylglycerol:prolipoprotein diacylglycerol transferase
MSGFVHEIDPVLGELFGVYLWWYGLSYTLGFLGIHLWLRRVRSSFGLSRVEVLDACICLVIGVLLGGRLVEIFFYEWEYYRGHLWHIPAYWLGGMSTHGLMLGAIVGTLIFCAWRRKSFLDIADELVIPGAWVMGIGRIGNFIDGQIAGAVTDVWWAVQFPDLEGLRHPVVLYDGLKNLLLIPLLLLIRRRDPPRGVLFAQFLFWYAFLRMFVDLFREYRVESFGLGTGQVINLAMAATGAVLLVWFHRQKLPRPASSPSGLIEAALWPRRILLVLLLLFCLVIPSDWTQDVPARYGKRHSGLQHSSVYPPIGSARILLQGMAIPPGRT